MFNKKTTSLILAFFIQAISLFSMDTSNYGLLIKTPEPTPTPKQQFELTNSRKNITINNKSWLAKLNINILNIETVVLKNPSPYALTPEYEHEKTRISLKYLERIQMGVSFEIQPQATTLEIMGSQEPGTVQIPTKTLQPVTNIDIRSSREYANKLVYSITNKSCTQKVTFINKSSLCFFNITVLSDKQVVARYPEVDQKKGIATIYIDPQATILEIQGTSCLKHHTLSIPIADITPDVSKIEITGKHYGHLYYVLHYKNGSTCC